MFEKVPPSRLHVVQFVHVVNESQVMERDNRSRVRHGSIEVTCDRMKSASHWLDCYAGPLILRAAIRLKVLIVSGRIMILYS